MKRVILVLITFIIFYFSLQVIFFNFGKGHIINYKVDGFEINEELLQNTKDEIDNYYIELKKDDTTFTYQIFTKNRGSNLIKTVRYFKNSNYECIVPILKLNDIKLDPVCKKDGINYYYSEIKGIDLDVDKFFQDYKLSKKKKILKESNNIVVYDNILDNHFIELDYYKGIYSINKNDKLKQIKLFKKEIYEKQLSIVYKNYYVIADYNELYDFHKFYIVDFTNYKINEIISDKSISLNSYIQGIVDNEIYIFDVDNKIQYKINIDNKDIYIVGNEKKGIKKYKNGQFIDGNVYEDKNELLFTDYTNKLDDKSYSRVILKGGKKSGYYYLYEENNSLYNVYRVPVRNHNDKTYLFTTSDIDSVKYTENYIYYKYDNMIKRFSTFDGNNDIVKYKDLKYNKSLKFNVYEK